MKLKVFVSVPMNGWSDSEIAAEVSVMLHRLQSNHIETELIDSFVQEDAPVNGNRSGIWYLGKSLLSLATADAACFAEGWEQSRGCRIEHAVCEEYGIPILSDPPVKNSE